MHRRHRQHPDQSTSGAANSHTAGTDGGFTLPDWTAAAIFLIFAATLLPWKCNFPINDDWAYALAARDLAAAGRLKLCDWAAPTQIPHLLWGALFIKISGFSFSALRIAGLLASAAGLWVFVKLLGEFGIGRSGKLLAALALALNPLYLALADSFMTDQHYLFWMLASCLFYVKRLKDPANNKALLLAGACTAMAYLTRQLAVALPLAYVLVLLFHRRFSWRELAGACALPAAAMLGYYLWFKYVNGPTWASASYIGTATLAHLVKPGPFLWDSLRRTLSTLMETGLLLLPLAAGLLPGVKQFLTKTSHTSKLSAAAPWLALAALSVFALASGSLPYIGNTLSRSGVGLLTLGGPELKPSGIFSSGFFWSLATAASAASAALLLWATGFSLRTGGPALSFVFAAAALQFGISLIGAAFFDRYLLTLLPWFALAAAFAAKSVRFHRPAAWTVLILCAALSWAGMKDYMAWNTAKWELAARPHSGLPRDQIANGFDYEAWFNYQKSMDYLKTTKPLAEIGVWEWRKFCSFKALITFAPDQRFSVLDKIEYSTPLSRRKGVIYMLYMPGKAGHKAGVYE